MTQPAELQRVERAKILAQLLVGAPSQEEIDSIAHFVEAVQELRASPFFIEEFRKLSISRREGETEMRGQFSNPDVVAAMLIPFRRMWQTDEPCFYRRVANLLKKHEPQQAEWIDSLVFSDKTCNISRWPPLNAQALPPSDVIDLWLNTRYMHTGRSRRRGKFTRKDFDDHENRMGKDLFEYYFQVAVHEVAISFFNLGRSCEGFLLACEGHGLRPSFMIREPLRDAVRRTTPGLTLRGDSPADRLWRLKRRKRHGELGEFLSLTDFSDERVSAEIAKSEQFDDLVKNLELRLEQRDGTALQQDVSMVYRSGVTDAQYTVLRNQRIRRGYIAKAANGQLYWGGECVNILRDQYIELREALLREPFV